MVVKFETVAEVLAEMRKERDECFSACLHWADRIERALSARAEVPKGWQLVPRVATGKMLAEARKRGRGLEECWAIMVDLAPAAPSVADTHCADCGWTGQRPKTDAGRRGACPVCDEGALVD